MKPRTENVPTYQQVRDLFEYDEGLGILLWKITSGRAIAGRPAGGVDKTTGYHRVRCCGGLWVSHFIIWLWKTGKWPENYIDHIDGHPENNVFANLRPATQAQNRANSAKGAGKTSLLKGVSKHAASGKFQAQIGIGGVNHYLGLHDTEELAHKAYVAAARAAFGEFACNGERAPVVEKQVPKKRVPGLMTAEEAWEHFTYDMASGGIRWRKAQSWRGPVGSLAGRLNSDGYRRIRLFGREYQAHVVAHLMVCGEYPKGKIDHVDGVRSNNAWSNLRECTQSQNLANTRISSRNTIGLKGVSRLPSGKYGAWIKVNGVGRFLGAFDTPEEAHQAYCAAAIEAWGEFARFK